MSFIEINHLRRDFLQGEFTVHAVNDVTFSIERAEFMALVGPSGSGKSTLLHCIGALDTPTSGSIVLDGEEITGLNPAKRASFRLHNIGFVFQAFNLVPVLTAGENVDYILVLLGIAKEERRERVRSLFADMGMEDLMDRFPHQISGGQQQRVAVARALVSRPRVVLADEPTANLDGKNADMLLDIMEGMCRKLQTTFLFSTHDERVMKRAERLIRLRDGRIDPSPAHSVDISPGNSTKQKSGRSKSGSP